MAFTIMKFKGLDIHLIGGCSYYNWSSCVVKKSTYLPLIVVFLCWSLIWYALPCVLSSSGAVFLLWIFYVFFLSYVCYAFVRVCLYVPYGHLLAKDRPLCSRLWCLTVGCHLPIGILGQVWYLIVSIPDLCTLLTLQSP